MNHGRAATPKRQIANIVAPGLCPRRDHCSDGALEGAAGVHPVHPFPFGLYARRIAGARSIAFYKMARVPRASSLPARAFMTARGQRHLVAETQSNPLVDPGQYIGAKQPAVQYASQGMRSRASFDLARASPDCLACYQHCIQCTLFAAVPSAAVVLWSASVLEVAYQWLSLLLARRLRNGRLVNRQ